MELRDRLQAALGSDYTIERELGGGGMSRVFVALEPRLGRRVVIKVLSPELAALLSTERFNREIQLAASLQQANIVPLLTAGMLDGVPFYTMPFVEGESVRARLARGPLSEADVISVLRDVARALVYAHGRGVVHRDIKPDNVLLSGEAAVVTDFGIAKALNAARTGPDAAATGLTQLGTAIGTPAYMAPEQATGDPATDHRADLYALGCMAYELLAGTPPFHGKAVYQLLQAHLSEVPPPLEGIRIGVDPALAALVMACLAKNPDARPATAKAFLHQLDALRSSGAREAIPTVLGSTPRRLDKVLGLWAVGSGAAWILARAAVVGIGLPRWTVTLVLAVAALALPLMVATWYVQRTARRALAQTPALTPGGSVLRGTMATLAIKASPHLSWRRTRLAGIASAVAVVLAVGGYVVLRQLGVGPAASLLSAGRIQSDSRILVSQFMTTSSDTSLGSVVAQAMRTSLGQSTAIRLVSPSEAAGALVRMTLPGSTPLSLATARELAVREGIPLIVTGQVAALGTGFMVTTSLVSSETGETLVELQRAADGPGALLNAIDALALDLRERIGESLRSVARAPRLEEATTASLAALREYTRGVEVGDLGGDWERGLQHLRAAVAVDSTFASAWRKIAVYESNLGSAESVQFAAAAAAYRFRERTVGTERQQIEAYYLGQVNTRAAIAAYRQFTGISRNNLALALNGAGRFAEAESVLVVQEVERAERGGARIIQEQLNLLRAQLGQRKHSEAAATIRVLTAEFPNTDFLERSRAWAAIAIGGVDSMPVVATRMQAASQPMSRLTGVGYERALAGAKGEYRRFLVLGRMMQAVADTAGNASAADPVMIRLGEILTVALASRDFARGLGALDSLVAANPEDGRPVLDRHGAFFAQAYARLGNVERARAQIAPILKASSPEERLYQWGISRIVDAEIALAEQDADVALSALRASVAADSGALFPAAYGDHFERMGRAFELAGRRDSAIVYLERYRAVEDFASVQGHLAQVYPDVLRRLGGLYAQQGDRPRALAAYEALLRLWRDADPVLAPAIADIRSRRDELGGG
ncbi:MAG: serine/threonine-protein kinase [Gemmatimonadota bacterium]|jgi:tRNA A-37 threonylcarbamoyl transferase component Bud32/tetratricopeptide (TPR) repeat protein|nr:serine/threonine-protein kinase [Gemmatimonadota bacterium]MDQ8147879.1 serine/threonine-protein kinase [Gemmatimonadota bacterium]MDQ8149605.1 serine/threonine-protein kinase [Gemmatimonadota bacterium]MDQ8157123.1 serine/threonine-protein kinase [Gemmatimonadota bacterium]MDQ8177259.1 serine/threonine-protein kinase [Gemmatimonadota bacterium]